MTRMLILHHQNLLVRQNPHVRRYDTRTWDAMFKLTMVVPEGLNESKQSVLRNVSEMVPHTNDGDPGKAGLLRTMIASIAIFFGPNIFDWHLRLQNFLSIDLTYCGVVARYSVNP